MNQYNVSESLVRDLFDQSSLQSPFHACLLSHQTLRKLPLFLSLSQSLVKERTGTEFSSHSSKTVDHKTVDINFLREKAIITFFWVFLMTQTKVLALFFRPSVRYASSSVHSRKGYFFPKIYIKFKSCSEGRERNLFEMWLNNNYDNDYYNNNISYHLISLLLAETNVLPLLSILNLMLITVI